jgi:hypothetical protein
MDVKQRRSAKVREEGQNFLGIRGNGEGVGQIRTQHQTKSLWPEEAIWINLQRTGRLFSAGTQFDQENKATRDKHSQGDK